MSKKVLDVGQCPPDHSAIRRLVESLGAEVEKVALPADAMRALKSGGGYSLVLVNRKIDRDYSDGMELVRMMRQDESTRETPIMVISNYDWAQEEAVKMGAVRGFGKNHLANGETRELLAKYLGS